MVKRILRACFSGSPLCIHNTLKRPKTALSLTIIHIHVMHRLLKCVYRLSQMFVTFLNHFDERDIALIFLCFQ